jgi:cation diffusion facilitator CzcD-associated flavoprotein CzcO
VTPTSDIAIIGGGIVGLATALAMTDRYPGAPRPFRQGAEDRRAPDGEA